jgi:hypothetical protein
MIGEGLFEVDVWKLLSSHSTGDVYTETLAMEIPESGCIVRVISVVETDEHSNTSEALTFVPWVKIEEVKDGDGELEYRKLVTTKKF